MASRLKQLSIVAGFAALFGAASMRNVLASTFLTVAGPLTAAGFVYEVQALRNAQLAHEAADRAQYAAYLATQANEAGSSETLALPALPAQPDILGDKLESMIRARAVLLDTFGDDSASIAPVYQTIIKQMLKDDEDAFAALDKKRKGVSGTDAAVLTEKEKRLIDVHNRLAQLARG